MRQQGTVRKSPDGAWLAHVVIPDAELFEAFRTLTAARAWAQAQMGYEGMVWTRDSRYRDLYSTVIED